MIGERVQQCGTRMISRTKIQQWYPYDIKNKDPNVLAREEKERLAQLKLLKRRGKGPPKKGQGRRAVKRNK